MKKVKTSKITQQLYEGEFVCANSAYVTHLWSPFKGNNALRENMETIVEAHEI